MDAINDAKKAISGHNRQISTLEAERREITAQIVLLENRVGFLDEKIERLMAERDALARLVDENRSIRERLAK